MENPPRTLAAVFLPLLLAGAPLGAQLLTIDSFETDHTTQQLVFPPAGTTTSASVSGPGILGGERDITLNLTSGVVAGNNVSATVSSGVFSYAQAPTIEATGRIDWDGVDGSGTLNPVGLGGLDLTSGGLQNAVLLRVPFADLPQNVVISIHTDGADASSFTLSLPGAIFSSADYVIPYSSFTTLLGGGADFSDVGAVSLVVGGPSAPDIVVDLLETTATLTAPKTVALAIDADGDGVVSPGDTLEYTIIINNVDDAFDAAETGVVFSNPAPANTTFVVGSVTTTQGTVTSGNTAGDTSAGVDVGTINDGASVTITFRVQIVNPLPLGVTAINCQGLVETPTLELPTDDPGTPTPNDPTGTPVVATAGVTAVKTGALAVDVNGDGQLGPGDTLEYTIVVTSTGNTPAAAVVFDNPAPLNTSLVVGSVTTTTGTVTIGNSPGDTSVQVTIGDMNLGATVTITFQVQLAAVLPPGTTQISCQGTVTGTNFPPQPTDDPATADPNDPTTNPVVTGGGGPPLIPTLGEWGLMALAASLGGLGVARLRRRRQG